MLKKISIISIVLLMVVLLLYFLLPFFNHQIPYVEAEEFDLQIEYVENIYTRSELKAMVDELFGNPRYIYEEKEELNFGALGNCNYYSITPIIQIKADTSDYYYPAILAHELVHAVYYTRSERFANLKAFEVLYNSGNDYLRYCALKHYESWLRYELSGETLYFDYCFAGNVNGYFV